MEANKAAVPAPERIKIKCGGSTYTVVRAGADVIRIEAVNAVLGVRNIDMTGRTAKRVLAALAKAGVA